MTTQTEYYRLGSEYVKTLTSIPLNFNKKIVKDNVDNVVKKMKNRDHNIFHWKDGAYKELGIKTVNENESYTEDQYARDTMTVSLLAPFRERQKGFIIK